MKIVKLLVGLQAYCTFPSSFSFVIQNAPHRQHHTPVSSQLYATETAVGATVENPRQSGLALMLDDGTRKSHSMAQNTQFVTGFFKGLANRDSYRSLVTSLYFVYNSMEEAMDSTAEARVQALDYSALRRIPPLKKDMEFFYGKNVSVLQRHFLF
jgi:hypothetical protein